MGGGGEWAVPGGLVHHLCWVPICLEDLLQVVSFSNQIGGMANFPGSGPQAFVDARLDPSMVVIVIVRISICVCLCEIWRWLLGFPLLYQYIKEDHLSILLLLHGELDGCLLGVHVSQECIKGLLPKPSLVNLTSSCIVSFKSSASLSVRTRHS